MEYAPFPLGSCDLLRTHVPQRSARDIHPPMFAGYTRPKPGMPDELRDQNDRSPVLLTVAEACAVLKISKWTLYQLIRSRRLETIRIGSRRMVPVDALHALVERLRAEEAM